MFDLLQAWLCEEPLAQSLHAFFEVVGMKSQGTELREGGQCRSVVRLGSKGEAVDQNRHDVLLELDRSFEFSMTPTGRLRGGGKPGSRDDCKKMLSGPDFVKYDRLEPS